MMIRIAIDDDVSERWRPVLERSFRMTLAAFQSELSALRVDLGRAEGTGGERAFVCRLEGVTRRGRKLHIVCRHDEGEQAIALAFTRARREMSRGQLRPPLLPPKNSAAGEPAARAGLS